MQLPHHCYVSVISWNAWFGKLLPQELAGYHSNSVCPTLFAVCTGVLKVLICLLSSVVVMTFVGLESDAS